LRRGISSWISAVLLTIAAGCGWRLLVRKTTAAAPSAITVVMTPERIARGRYIFTVADCDGCHSARDWTRFAGPVVESRRGEGVEFPRAPGATTSIISANITTDLETGLGRWPDGTKIRAIREGIGSDGRRLHPMMPYRRFRAMSDGDVAALVAYLNTLPPVRHGVSKTGIPLTRRWSNWFAPGSAVSVAEPDHADAMLYGSYLAKLAGCADCHTAGRRSPLGQELFGGGRPFHLSGGAVISTNITPDPHTGIGRWSEDDWLARVYQNREYMERGSPKVGPESLTVMPWLELCQWQPDDLKAVYAFLRAQKPVYRPIVPHPLR
jgi:mono/diheme cytochrome c family protein